RIQLLSRLRDLGMEFNGESARVFGAESETEVSKLDLEEAELAVLQDAITASQAQSNALMQWTMCIQMARSQVVNTIASSRDMRATIIYEGREITKEQMGRAYRRLRYGYDEIQSYRADSRNISALNDVAPDFRNSLEKQLDREEKVAKEARLLAWSAYQSIPPDLPSPSPEVFSSPFRHSGPAEAGKSGEGERVRVDVAPEPSPQPFPLEREREEVPSELSLDELLHRQLASDETALDLALAGGDARREVESAPISHTPPASRAPLLLEGTSATSVPAPARATSKQDLLARLAAINQSAGEAMKRLSGDGRKAGEAKSLGEFSERHSFCEALDRDIRGKRSAMLQLIESALTDGIISPAEKNTMESTINTSYDSMLNKIAAHRAKYLQILNERLTTITDAAGLRAISNELASIDRLVPNLTYQLDGEPAMTVHSVQRKLVGKQLAEARTRRQAGVAEPAVGEEPMPALGPATTAPTPPAAVAEEEVVGALPSARSRVGVIPAKAGIFPPAEKSQNKMPAYAGMTPALNAYF
ncbi:MAG: hypothetical protein HY586_00220, partial [Candidatus Omnitrophica bacterium]|nr:hypothetical protein [Candidatus Omnitrophota bacterium]